MQHGFGQHYLWNESRRLQARYVNFDVDALSSIASDALGTSAAGYNFTRRPESDYSKVFMVTTEDGKEVVVKITNPNNCTKHLTTASEVATMSYVITTRLSHLVELTEIAPNIL